MAVTQSPEATVRPRAFSVEQLAQAWGVSIPHLKAEIAAGHIPVFRVGRRVLIPLSVIEQIEAGAA